MWSKSAFFLLRHTMLHFSPLQFDNHLISPKEFVHLAGKSTLKDWKRAIRMNGIMLRLVSHVCMNGCGVFFLGESRRRFCML